MSLLYFHRCVHSLNIEVLAQDIDAVISKRLEEFRQPGGTIYTKQEVLCALELLRSVVQTDLTLAEQSNRER